MNAPTSLAGLPSSTVKRKEIRFVDRFCGGGTSSGIIEVGEAFEMPKNHPLGRRRRILFSEALENDFIGLGEGNAIQQFLAYQANRHNRRLKIRVGHLQDAMRVLNAALVGMGAQR